MSGSESSESAGIEELTRQVETLRRQLEKAQAENERLRKELEEALRSLKRQAAPFSRGKRKKKDRNRPGRKSGADYGKQARRPVPRARERRDCRTAADGIEVLRRSNDL